MVEHVVAEGFISDIVEPINSYDLQLPVDLLTYKNVEGSEPLEYRLKLLTDIREKSIIQPVIVVKGVDGFTLVDGNHRVALANDLRIVCPMFLVYCDCGVSLYNHFCDFTEKFKLERYRLGISEGWLW